MLVLYAVADSACVGYDGRHKSKDFANLAAAVFVSQGVNVHLFSEVVPTPFVAGAVSYKVAMTYWRFQLEIPDSILAAASQAKPDLCNLKCTEKLTGSAGLNSGSMSIDSR